MKNKKTWIILGSITLVGLIMRIICCFWGYPYVLHGDEQVVVHYAMDMLRRNSYLMHCYHRPDQFETKCCLVLFQIVSYLRYGVPAHEAIETYGTVFYIVARGFTACWGTLMIPLGYLILEKCRKGAGLIGAAAIAFYPTFIQHSAYATPDIVLTFFAMAVVYISILYLEKPSWKKLALMCVGCGIAVTIKYPGAILSIWIALAVIVSCVQRKKYLEILTSGLFSIALVLLVCFAIAPEILMYPDRTIAGITVEARDVHLGADGLNMWQNFCFYIRLFAQTMGYESILFLFLGMAYCIKKRNFAVMSMGFGFVFWICMSSLGLHWERWGMPIYAFWVMLIVLGICFAWELVKSLKKESVRKVGTAVTGLLIGIVMTSTVLSSLWIVQFSMMEDSRVAGKKFCDANGIVQGNTVYDGYSPLEMRGSTTIPVGINEDGEFMLPAGKQNALFLMISSGMYGRFYAEPERYADIIKNYDRVMTYKQIYESELYENHMTNWCTSKIWWNIYDLINSQGKHTGPVIKIYQYE